MEWFYRKITFKNAIFFFFQKCSRLVNHLKWLYSLVSLSIGRFANSFPYIALYYLQARRDTTPNQNFTPKIFNLKVIPDRIM